MCVWLLVPHWVVCWTLVLPVLLLTRWVVPLRTQRREQLVVACLRWSSGPICNLYPYTGMFSSVAVLSCGPCPCSKLYMGVLGANHGGQTCVAAPLSIMISTLFSSCWTDWSVDAIGVDDILLFSGATRCMAAVCCSCAVVGVGAVSASCGVCWGCWYCCPLSW